MGEEQEWVNTEYDRDTEFDRGIGARNGGPAQ